MLKATNLCILNYVLSYPKFLLLLKKLNHFLME